ncbi:MAG: DUF4230 domain-containing protein [Verrucomicrobia bacterium]|nr:DUF4230 domain-containing protein [Verrucomicrobiota bacterium]
MQRRPNYWPLAFVLAIALLVLGGVVVVDRIADWPASVLRLFHQESSVNARRVRDAFIQLFQFQPRISVNNHVVIQETKSTLELAVVERNTEVTLHTSQTWLGSTKNIRVHGLYQVKAGFDLSHQFDVQVSGQDVLLRMPPAKILSVEPLSVSVEEMRDGLWNRVQPQDIDEQLKSMLQSARTQENSLPAEAEKTLMNLLSEKMKDLHFKVEIMPDQERIPESKTPNS